MQEKQSIISHGLEYKKKEVCGERQLSLGNKTSSNSRISTANLFGKNILQRAVSNCLPGGVHKNNNMSPTFQKYNRGWRRYSVYSDS